VPVPPGLRGRSSLGGVDACKRHGRHPLSARGRRTYRYGRRHGERGTYRYVRRRGERGTYRYGRRHGERGTYRCVRRRGERGTYRYVRRRGERGTYRYERRRGERGTYRSASGEAEVPAELGDVAGRLDVVEGVLDPPVRCDDERR